MDQGHPLDRPAWGALTTRWAALAIGGPRAMRLDPDHGPFAAAADATPESLAAFAALDPAEGGLAMVEAVEMPAPPGLVVTRRATCLQMVATSPATPPPAASAPDIVPLGEADAGEMRALALLTEPGPFHARTHRLGAFHGIRRDGRLAAMAGERMNLPGFTEVSGVCAHPDHRGRGFAGLLMRQVMAGIVARGETPFLHVYPENARAIALYETLGFRTRRAVTLTVLDRA